MGIDGTVQVATLTHIGTIAYLGYHATKSPYYAAGLPWAPRDSSEVIHQ